TYIETSVGGMALPSQPKALREPTKQFLNQCRSQLFVAFISTVVLQEIARANPRDAARMLRQMNELLPVELAPTRPANNWPASTSERAFFRPRNLMMRAM